jgi:hypothetical protein
VISIQWWLPWLIGVAAFVIGMGYGWLIRDRSRP